jgi:hypothetical protein
VYYLHFSASKGRGKTTGLDVLAALTGALNASDISVAALVHWLAEHPCGAVLADEYGAGRDAEKDSALAAIARSGNMPGKPYLRWNPTKRMMDECPTYGAKAFGFRGAVDDALEDRGFTLPLPTTALRGREGTRLVARNMNRSFADLPLRLKKWGARTVKEWTPPIYDSDEWCALVEAVVGDSAGTSRDTQLSMVVLAVADAVGVDVIESLREALGLKREVAEANLSEDLEEAKALLGETFSRTGTLTGEAEFYVLKQAEFFRELNARRKERGQRPLDNSKRAALREDLGIDKAWLARINGFPIWKVPKKEWDSRHGRGDTPPSPPSPLHGDADRGRMGRMGRGGTPEPPSGPVAEESHLSDRPTLADRALANARTGGSLAPDPLPSCPPKGHGEAVAWKIKGRGSLLVYSDGAVINRTTGEVVEWVRVGLIPVGDSP